MAVLWRRGAKHCIKLLLAAFFVVLLSGGAQAYVQEFDCNNPARFSQVYAQNTEYDACMRKSRPEVQPDGEVVEVPPDPNECMTESAADGDVVYKGVYVMCQAPTGVAYKEFPDGP